MQIKSELLTVDIDDLGYIASLVFNDDRHKMNFVSRLGHWGKVNFRAQVCHTQGGVSFTDDEYTLKDLSVENNRCAVKYENLRTAVEVTRYFKENGNLVESYKIVNRTDTTVCFNRDFLGIELPTNDEYTYADECMVSRCHTHIWCGGNTSWVNCLKMGASDINLGLILTRGALVSYSQHGCHTNVRGYFELEPESVMLTPGKAYEIEWEIFSHTYDDFFDKLKEYDGYIGINAKHFTIFEGESIEFEIFSRTKPTVRVNNTDICVTENDGKYGVSYTPIMRGEHRFYITAGKNTTFADFNVKADFGEILKNRMDFFVKKQQCLIEESQCYGAFLIYDNKTDSQYFDFFNPDHNACRERLNMALLLARYLQLYKNDEYRKAFDLFMAFVYREFFEEATGEVFNTVGKIADMKRLYNSPGVMLLFAEACKVTGDKKLLRDIMKLADNYYSIGGHKCYSNAVAIKKVISVLRDAGLSEESNRLLQYFKKHTDTMIENGTSYPKHEVNFEQTIVTPAVFCISEMGMFAENKSYYTKKATEHLEILKRFSGMQPSYRLNEIAIRFWDDYWFGKGRLFGDTLPHHLSVLTARAYDAYATLSGDKIWRDKAEENIRNCMCLLDDDGHGHAASIYPHKSDNALGEFFDGWANDQDLVLYDALYLPCDAFICEREK